LSSCTALKLSNEPILIESYDSRQEFLDKLDRWEFRSRIAIKVGEEGFNGKLHWIQTSNKSYLTVNGPIGFGALKIKSDGVIVSLTDINGNKSVLENPEIDIFNIYGWHIPFKSFQYWILGISNPSVKKKFRVDEDGLINWLQQGNWEIKISRYRKFSGQKMPYILKMSNSDTHIRIVIDKWMFN
jgi:outer membrane lipoprotein LolB